MVGAECVNEELVCLCSSTLCAAELVRVGAPEDAYYTVSVWSPKRTRLGERQNL